MKVGRVVAVLLLLLLALPLSGLPAAAVEGAEGEAERPSYEDIVGRNEVVQENAPAAYEQPTVFPPLIFAFLGLGLLTAVALLLLFLAWQPKFAVERRRRLAARR